MHSTLYCSGYSEINLKFVPSINVSTSSEGTSNTAPIPSAVSAMPFMAEIFSSGSILLNIVKANLHSNQLKVRQHKITAIKSSTSLENKLCYDLQNYNISRTSLKFKVQTIIIFSTSH